MTRTDATINFTTWASYPPITGIPGNFSVRWTGYLVPLYSETYTLTTVSDDGVRVIMNNQTRHRKLDRSWPYAECWRPITLVAGKRYAITVEYYQGGGGAIIQLSWQSQSQQMQYIPQSQLFPS